ncbi:MAG: SDR family NAD(P)-dependent oxidoreductase [Candidatus Nomurabacteria bacterium]|nr:MAG: SDR family NAD(P)-dependent oxidoreductase [Candidatus Nomurabacteria bacterium]
MNYLITGSAGFIGSHLSTTLLAQGHRVIGIDDLNDYYSVTQKQENITQLKEFSEYSFLQCDIRKPEEIKTFLQKYSQPIDAIIHLAARAGVRPSIAKPTLYTDVNVNGTVQMLELARVFQIPKFIFASSSSVYGNQEKTPFSETDAVDTPISPYAATKRAGELLSYTYHALHGMSVACLRFFTVYGPKGRPDMAPYLFVDKVHRGEAITKFGNGETRRDYTYIEDIISGILASLQADIGYEIINLGNSHTISLNEFIATVERVTGKTAIVDQQGPQPGDVQQTFADITKAKKLLGYDPSTAIESGLQHFYEWYKRYRV